MLVLLSFFFLFFFFFNDTATTEIYTLSLHDALPISPRWYRTRRPPPAPRRRSAPWLLSAARSRRARRRVASRRSAAHPRDRKSTRLNSSHLVISYAVFCLKKKKKQSRINIRATPMQA